MLKKLGVVGLIFVFALGLSFSIAGCAGKPVEPKKVVDSAYKGAPDWVKQGCYAYWGEKKGAKKVCGIGSIGGSRNVSLMRTTALSRARTDIARQLGTKVKSMVKDYQATVTGGEDFGIAVSDEQYVVEATKQITNQTLVGVEQVDSWIGDDGTLWVLAAMNLEKFDGLVNQLKGLSASLRKHIEERAEKAFDELDEETAEPETE